MSEKKDLTELRSEIDSIDRELMRLFEERMNISRQVGDYKRERGMPVFDETREKEVIAARTALIGEEALRPYASRLMHNIMDYSKEVQKRPGGKVAFQGCRGAYSEEAARTYFPDAELAAKEQFEDVFRAVARGEAEAGVVPVENSAAGSVTANIDLLGRYDLSVRERCCCPSGMCCWAHREPPFRILARSIPMSRPSGSAVPIWRGIRIGRSGNTPTRL